MGVNAISFTEMQAYFYLHFIEPTIEEIEMIKLFDMIALKTMQEQQEKEQASAKKGKSPTPTD